jgi:uncharacterized protein
MPDTVRPTELIRKYYSDSPKAWEILLEHSRRVTQRALRIARNLQTTESLDLQFIAEAAMLHDIGIVKTDTPGLGCYGRDPYLTHGIAGRAILEAEGLPKHALVCERHIGIGLTAEEIEDSQLPLPKRDMRPISLEEKIICYADLFFSKDPERKNPQKSVAKIRKSLRKFGADKVAVFDEWVAHFEPELS